MKKAFAVILALTMMLTLFGCGAEKEPETTTTTTTTTETTTQPAPIVNPLTGEEGYRKKAVGVRPVAIVVENSPAARPQWGIGSSDIICEGEVEGGISRMLWIYADMKSVASVVGPLRSARPSFVEFSELFDAIFIHWGGSHKRNGYLGGYTVISRDKVDNIDGMKGGKLFSRNRSRKVATEHTGVLDGAKIAAVVKDKKYRTELNESAFPSLSFNESAESAGDTDAKSVRVTFSSRTDTRKFEFNEKDKLYHTSDWKTDVSFENVIVLMASSDYITVPYKGSRVTYLNYKWSNGKGYYISCGGAAEIRWSAENGTLELSDAEGKPLKINQGKSYIGFASSNHSGKVSFPKK